MIIVLYILLGISILAPIYTYVLYPFVLKLLPQKVFKAEGYYSPTISVIIINDDVSRVEKRENEILNAHNNGIMEMVSSKNQNEAIAKIPDLKGDVIIVSDGNSSFLQDTIPALIAPLGNKHVACVSGMSRKVPDDKGNYSDGANWKYENRIKCLETGLGCLSGANPSVFAFKREALKGVIDKKIHLDFYIPTSIEEQGFDVLFEPTSVVYEEERSESELFRKHIEDGASGYRSIARFWRLLLPRHGSFVFWSHRVLKWLVPINMLILLMGAAIISLNHIWALALLLIQMATYLYVTLYFFLFSRRGKKLGGSIGKISEFATYFITLNIAWFLGIFKKM